MSDLNNKSVLLFCPKFFGYESEIKRGLILLGANVTWFDDRPGNDFLSKALIRINKGVLKNKINAYYRDILSKLSGQNFDYLFFVNPEAISQSIVSDFKKQFPNARCLLYMWDSFKNRKQNLELLPLFDNGYTFDLNDANTYNLKLRPLFYIDAYKATRDSDILKYDILFIGTAHTDRYYLVKSVTCHISNDKKKLYFFLSGKALYYFRKAFNKNFRGVKYNDISFRALNHSDIAELMSESLAVLDINHPKQTGLTMRTFETLGAGKKLITTNAEVVKYDLYNPNNILVIDREKPIIDLGFLKSPMDEIPMKILNKYSLEGWIKEIFEIL